MERTRARGEDSSLSPRERHGASLFPPSMPTFVDDRLDDHGVLQDVLTPGLEELDALKMKKRKRKRKERGLNVVEG
jgi:hypothetical protein